MRNILVLSPKLGSQLTSFHWYKFYVDTKLAVVLISDLQVRLVADLFRALTLFAMQREDLPPSGRNPSIGLIGPGIGIQRWENFSLSCTSMFLV